MSDKPPVFPPQTQPLTPEQEKRKSDLSERAEVQAYRQCLRDCEAAKAAWEMARRAPRELSGPLMSDEAAALEFWRSKVRVDEAEADMNRTDPDLIEALRFLDAELDRLVAAFDAPSRPVLASADGLTAHVDALLASSKKTSVEDARARVRVAWQAVRDLLEVLTNQRKAARLPAPCIRGWIGGIPQGPSAVDEFRRRLAEPYFSPARGQVVSLERLAEQRADQIALDKARAEVRKGLGYSAAF